MMKGLGARFLMENMINYKRERMTTDAHLQLSAAINYEVEATKKNKNAILALILGPESPFQDRKLMMQALNVVLTGYGDTKRKFRGMAVVHPLRTAAIVARCVEHPTVTHMVTALLHDRDEDLKDLTGRHKDLFEQELAGLHRLLSNDDGWYVGERIALLTRKSGEHYVKYVARILGHTNTMMDLLHVKCADRLDNTLDHGLQHRSAHLNWFRAMHDALFVPSYRGVILEDYHQLPENDQGGAVLSMAFKNTIFMSLVRQCDLALADRTTVRFIDALAVASIRVVGWIALGVLAGDVPPVSKHREFLLDVMQYIQEGGLMVRSKGQGSDLDGMLLDYWHNDSQLRKKRMSEIFADRERLLKLCCLLIAIFSSFLNDPRFFVKGIGLEDVEPVSYC
jgi:hypothetical protein